VGNLPASVADITPAWLTATLRAAGFLPEGSVTTVTAQPLGGVAGYLSSIARLRLTYDQPAPAAPAALIAKWTSASNLLQKVALELHAFEREVGFYHQVAPSSGIRVPLCYFGQHENAGGSGLVLLEDLGDLQGGDDVVGLSFEQALTAVETIGRFHARWWQKPELVQLDWLADHHYLHADFFGLHWALFSLQMASTLPAEALVLGNSLAEKIPAVLARAAGRPCSLVHADFRADNLRFNPQQPREGVAILDWQVICRGLALYDVARLAAGSLATDLTRQQHAELCRRWHDALVAGGVKDYPQSELEDDYKLAMLIAMHFPLANYLWVDKSERRSADLVKVMTHRFFHAAIEIQAGDFLRGL
jgi:hypothetical protein